MTTTTRNTSQEPLTELVFELSVTGESKFCFGISNDTELQSQITETIAVELLKHGITTTIFQYKKGAKPTRHPDIVEFLISRVPANSRQVVIVSGIDFLSRNGLTRILADLNFKRDILIERKLAILFWASDSVLREFVSKAPDLWSRRSGTFYFTRSPVKDLLSRLFGKKDRGALRDITAGKVEKMLQKIFSAERELNILLHGSRNASPLAVDKLIRNIRLAIKNLILECERTSGFLVTHTLWKLARVDQWLYRNFSHDDEDAHFRFREMYDERIDMIIEVSSRIGRILKTYNASIAELAANKKDIQLLHYFDEFVSRQIERKYEKIERDIDVEDLTDPAELENISSDEFEIEDNYCAAAVGEIRNWLESDDSPRPTIFSNDEERLLKLLYRRRGIGDLGEIAKTLNVSRSTAEKQLQTLRIKLSAIFGFN